MTAAPTAAALPPFRPLADLLREHAAARPDHPALVQGGERLSWAQLDVLMDRIAAALQRDGLVPGDTVVLAGATSAMLAALFLGALRAGVVVAPLATSVTPATFAAMCRNAAPRRLFVDAQATPLLAAGEAADCVALEPGAPGQPMADWLAPEGSRPQPVAIGPESPFNIIYSSGTTGEPKGIVQPHGMRWQHIHRGARYGYGPQTVTLLSTPLYSNTTLVVFFPTLGFGGTVHLMPRFDAGAWLALAEAERVTHTMLVPVQYRRLLAHPDFDRRELGAFVAKFCTSAPFDAALKAEALRRWPGGLIEFYGLTEGGGTCILEAHAHPDKLHTVGRPAEGHDIRLIDEAGFEVATGAAGEVVGRSAAMMSGYHGRPALSCEAEWFAPDGLRFIRSGDVGRFDADGFLVLVDRRKDMIISGGFNVYPKEVEDVIAQHPAVAAVAVIGVPDERWGEAVKAVVVRRGGAPLGTDEVRALVRQAKGSVCTPKTVEFADALPLTPLGKPDKKALRERYWAGQARSIH